MTQTTYQELLKMSLEDLNAALKKARHHVFKLRLEARTNQLKEVTKVKIAQKEVARILTAMTEMTKKVTK